MLIDAILRAGFWYMTGDCGSCTGLGRGLFIGSDFAVVRNFKRVIV